MRNFLGTQETTSLKPIQCVAAVRMVGMAAVPSLNYPARETRKEVVGLWFCCLLLFFPLRNFLK